MRVAKKDGETNLADLLMKSLTYRNGRDYSVV